ncbi:hypothetical protein FSP39_021031 [Pinctada imbricata]|uniref:Poly [ADP-ribose] polymerase 12-like n=1 Tax=Pinctada imbricata TaxID=66713 RepID=A0AA88YI04_PINIB|nr:hypothetical protein FSP39_021031 [Pinctada imbricata]
MAYGFQPSSFVPPRVEVPFEEQLARKTIEILCRAKKALSLRDLVIELGRESHLRLSEKQLHDIITKFPNNFNFVYKDREIENVYVSAVTKLSLCREHCSKQGQCGGAEKEGKPCPYLHMCKFYVIGQCRFGKGCKRNHDIFNQQVRDILTKYGIDVNRSPKEILAEIRSADFDFGDDTSSQASGSTVDHFRRVSELDQDLSDDDDEAESTTMNANVDPTVTEICIFHLRGRCAFGKSCRKLHYNTTYVWQYRKKDLMEWVNFSDDHNREIEMTYSDVNNTECYLDAGNDLLLRMNFDTMRGQGLQGGQIALQVDVRRLSTASSEREKFQPLATTWTWYWQDQTGQWVEYGQGATSGYRSSVDSSSMEQKYLENPSGQMRFATMGHEYAMDFAAMCQQNMEYETKRKVRRRPVFVDNREMEAKKKQSPSNGTTGGKPVSMVTGPALTKPMMSYIPDSWQLDTRHRGHHITDHFQRTVITGVSSCVDEVKKIKDQFFMTMPSTAYITCVERVENGELWMNFASKMEKMKRKSRNSTVDQRTLFHGTTSKYVDAICRQGFDFRFSGKTTGTKFGKGSYFAKSARYADSYTDHGADKEMFLVKVLVGDFAKGDKSMVRPPPKNPADPFELFDSCVDDVSKPNIFVIFTFDQVYPEYVIRYRNRNVTDN